MATLKITRQNHGISAEKLANLAGVSLSTIVRAERGRPPITRLTAGKIITALNRETGQSYRIEDIDGLKLKEEEPDAVALAS